MEQASSTNARTVIAGSKKCSECQLNTTQFAKPGPLLQVALTLIEQTVGAGPLYRTERSSSDPRDILETPRLIAGTHEMFRLVRIRYNDFTNQCRAIIIESQSFDDLYIFAVHRTRMR